MTVSEALTSSPSLSRLDREILLAHTLKKERVFLFSHPEQRLSAVQKHKYLSLLQRRKKHEPIAYLVGEKEFYGLSFFVNRHTLIPRPETELMVDEALSFVRNKKSCAIVDVGTGSGNIIISLAKHLPSRHCTFFATDISLRALSMARKNAQHHGVSERITFKKSDLLSDILPALRHFRNVVIVANLPYLSQKLYQSAPPNVRKFEPKTALVSGPRGLDHYVRLLREIGTFPEGVKVHFLLEISPEQARLLPSFFRHYPRILRYDMKRDLARKARLVLGSID